MKSPQQNLIIYNSDDGKAKVALYLRDNDVWLTQNQLSDLFATSVENINTHIKNILSDNELEVDSVIKDYLITAQGNNKRNIYL